MVQILELTLFNRKIMAYLYLTHLNSVKIFYNLLQKEILSFSSYIGIYLN